jgi:hypothetical protein
MSSGGRALVSLAVIAAGVGLTMLALWLRPPPPPPPAAQNRPIFDLAPGRVRAIDLESWQGTLRARRQDGVWRVELFEVRRPGAEPDDSAASAPPTASEIDDAVAELVRAIVETPEIDRFPLDGRPLADFGLGQPQAKVTLELDAGPARILEVGQHTVTTTALYARTLPGEDVLEIGSLFFNSVDSALFRLRGLAGQFPPGGAANPDHTG